MSTTLHRSSEVNCFDEQRRTCQSAGPHSWISWNASQSLLGKKRFASCSFSRKTGKNILSVFCLGSFLEVGRLVTDPHVAGIRLVLRVFSRIFTFLCPFVLILSILEFLIMPVPCTASVHLFFSSSPNSPSKKFKFHGQKI